VSKGESLKDTALTLQAMGADAVVCRHHASGAPRRLSAWVDGSVVNAGDGTHEHPTQALLDAFTLRRHLVGAGSRSGAGARPGSGVPGDAVGTDLGGRRVVIVGDVLHSRVARSNVPCCPPWARRSRWSRRPPCSRSAWRDGRPRCPTTWTPNWPAPTR
jgi:aspartate carbamoyltransferase catalytic subunit